MIYDAQACKLGEGPLWHPERQQFFWFDILNRRLLTKGRHWTFQGHVSAAGWVDRETLLIASDSALLRFNVDTGAQEDVVPLEADKPGNRSNDGRADPQGGFWIGTMGLNAEPGAGAIYRFYKGELRQLYPDIQISNAICFAPDGQKAYFTDTNTQQIMAVALDGDGWPDGDPRVHVDLTGTPYRPDGAVVDRDGNLFSAQWGVGRVAVYDPAGRYVESFALPATQTSCPAFGGAALQTLYVTSAAIGLKDADAHQGQTFAIDTAFTGQAEHRVNL